MPMMVSTSTDQPVGAAENVVYDLRLSSVVPASITGDDKRHELTNMDLIQKLHYITTVHFFEKDAVEGLSIEDFKKPMFQWLQLYYPICGRIRRSADSKPYIKCNDSGVRIVEAKCTRTVTEWLQLGSGDHHLLVYSQPLAHDLEFTPLVFLQFTKFKCGGISVGMSWAHLMGNAFSAVQCINTWGKIMDNQSHKTSNSPFIKNNNHFLPATTAFCRCVKLLDPVGHNWPVTPNSSKMKMHTFHLTEKLLNNLLLISSNKVEEQRRQHFEVICGIIWKSLAKIKQGKGSEPKIVTVCRKDSAEENIELSPSNRHLVFGTVEAPMASVAEADWIELSKLIAEEILDETKLMEKEYINIINGNNKQLLLQDAIVYGANLTFVDLEEVDLYGLRVKGKEPVFASLSIGGVGDEGTVVVLPSGSGKINSSGGRIVNVILPEDQLQHLKNELRVEWGIF